MLVAPLVLSFSHQYLAETRQVDGQSLLGRSFRHPFPMQMIVEAATICYAVKGSKLAALFLGDENPLGKGEEKATEEKSAFNTFATSHGLPSKS